MGEDDENKQDTENESKNNTKKNEKESEVPITRNSRQVDLSWEKPAKPPEKKVRRGGLGDNISDELRKLPGGKYPAAVVDGIATFINESPLVVKTANKIRSLPGGNTAVNVLGKAYGTITSKPVLRTLKATSAIVSMVNFPIGTIAGGLSLAAIGGNIVKETLDVREVQRLDAKKKNLESIIENKQKQTAFIDKNKETVAKDSPVLQKFLEDKKPNMNPSNRSPDVPLKDSRLKEFGRAIRDSSLAATSLILTAAEFGNPIGIVAAVATGGIGTLKNADANLARREQINNKKNEINDLNQHVEHYENSQKLKELELQERIKTETLKQFLSTPDIDKLSKEELEHIYDDKKREVEDKKEFQLPKKTKLQKAKSAIRATAGYVYKSQFGELEELYSKKKEETNVNKNSEQGKKPEQEKGKSKKKEQEKIHKVALRKANELKEKLGKAVSFVKQGNKSPGSSPNPPRGDDGINH